MGERALSSPGLVLKIHVNRFELKIIMWFIPFVFRFCFILPVSI